MQKQKRPTLGDDVVRKIQEHELKQARQKEEVRLANNRQSKAEAGQQFRSRFQGDIMEDGFEIPKSGSRLDAASSRAHVDQSPQSSEKPSYQKSKEDLHKSSNSSLKRQVEEAQNRITDLEQAVARKDSLIASLRHQIDRLQQEQLDRDDCTNELRERTFTLKAQLRDEIDARKAIEREHEESLKTIRDLRTQLSVTPCLGPGAAGSDREDMKDFDVDRSYSNSGVKGFRTFIKSNPSAKIQIEHSLHKSRAKKVPEKYSVVSTISRRKDVRK